MKVISTNIANVQTVKWKGKNKKTGIFKRPVDEIHLQKTGVVEDNVLDKKHHGGVEKACYLYAHNHYPYWKKKYPNLDWEIGMFGENLTVDNLDETKLFIGDTFEIGTAIIQISEPRLPCSILGVRFGTQKMVKQFANTTFFGAYTRILKEGVIKPGDTFKLVEKQDGISLANLYSIFFTQKDNKQLIGYALENPFLADDFKNNIRKKLIC